MSKVKERSEEIRRQLGMSQGSARNKLHKSILFDLICKAELNICFQCGEYINSIDDLSIEHMKPWWKENNAVDLYFDLQNIAFSHLSCNSSASRKNKSECGTYNKYTRYGCRCEDCVKAKSECAKSYYCSEKRSERYERLGT